VNVVSFLVFWDWLVLMGRWERAGQQISSLQWSGE